MYGNTGQKWVQIKTLTLNGLRLDDVGSEFTIGDYYSVPHGYASIKYKECLLFIPDKVFEEHFVKWEIYKQYYHLGDEIMLNANGNLGKYVIENINGNSCFVTLSLKHY